MCVVLCCVVLCQVLGANVSTRVCADNAELCQQWMKSGRLSYFERVRCMFSDLNEVTARKGTCHFHCQRTCTVRGGAPDIVCVGLPCSPFTMLRGDRASTPPQSHGEFQCLLDFIDYMRAVRPGCGFVEEVQSMKCAVKPSQFRPIPECQQLPTSWAHFLRSKLRELGYACEVLSLDNIYWNDVPRERWLM